MPSKTETTFTAKEIEYMASSVYAATHKGKQWKKWPKLDEIGKAEYRRGVAEGLSLINFRRKP